MRRAGMGQRTVLWLEPSRGFAAVVYGVLAMALLGGLGALTLDPRGSVSRTLARVGPLPDLVHNSLALAVALGLMCLLAMTAVVDGRRWRTTRAVKRLAEDPALAGLLPPDEADERRPVAPHRPDLRVEFVSKPWFGGQPRPLHRVEEHRNVVGRRPLSILYLRVFENQPRARTFIKGAWREFGYVHLLRSATAVDPATFRKAREGGGLPALFIASDDRLNAALAGAPTAPMPRGWHRERTIAGSTVLVRDRYAAYPVRSLICHGTYWKRAIALLLARSDLVVLDLSGYLPRNDGTRYELQRLVDTVPFERVVLVADPRSGKRFLRAELTRAWDNMAAGSPNAGVGVATVEIAIIDYYRRFERQTSSGTTEQTRLELHARRSETRWLLARVSSRLEHARAVSPDVPPPSALVGRHADRPDTAHHDTDRHDTGRHDTGHATRGRAVLLVTAALGVIAAVAVLLTPSEAVPTGLFGPSGVTGTVKPGDGYNVRAGPSTATSKIDALPAGTAVVVECLDGSWSRLAEPHAGGYIASNGLELTEDPPPC